MAYSQIIPEGEKPFLPPITIKESEIINFYNAMSKRLYPLEGQYYTLDDETQEFKKITIDNTDISSDVREKLNYLLSPELIIKHDNYDILTTSYISNKIIEFIDNSDKYCFLVTPYFKSWNNFEKCLKTASEKKKKIVFFLRDDIYYKKEIRDFHEQFKFDMIFIKNLHAKLFLNDHEALITSMNIYDYSKENNHEIGVLIKNKDDVKEILNEFIINELFKNSFIKGKEPLFLEGNYYQLLKNDYFFEEDINNCRISYETDNKNILEENSKNQTNSDNNILKEEVSEIVIVKNEVNLNVNEINKGYCNCCPERIPYNEKSPLCKECSEKKDKKSIYCHRCGSTDIKPEHNLCHNCWNNIHGKKKRYTH
jgi:hypothetical protein